MAVSQFCNRKIVTISKESDALQAAKLMRRHRTSTLVVIDTQSPDSKKIPVGLLEEGILSREVLAKSLDPQTQKVAALMNPLPISINEQTAIWEAIEAMRERNLRRLPVMDADGNLTGLLAADDIIDLLLAGLSDILALTRETRLPARQRRGHNRTAGSKKTRPTRPQEIPGVDDSTPGSEQMGESQDDQGPGDA